MKKSLGAMLLLIAAATEAWSQVPRVRVITHPSPPNREMLKRMDMDLHWHLKLTKFDEKDGLFSVQVIPGDFYPQLVAQTWGGDVILIDGETGDVIWRAGLKIVPTKDMFPVAFNSHSIYVVRSDSLYILDRVSGNRLLYLYDPEKKLRYYYGLKLTDPYAKPFATPVADEDTLYFTSGDRIIALMVPNYKRFGEPFPLLDSSKKPSLKWVYFTGKTGVANAPIVTSTQVGICKVDGTFQSLEKEKEKVRFTFKTVGRVGAAMGVHAVYTTKTREASAYIGSEDQTLYALDLFDVEQPLTWRFLSPGPIRRKPYVTDRDVFIKVETGEFFRIDRADGRDVWSNKQALQFMGCNRLFVYTRDATGSLLIHDYLRGSVLAEWDFRDWGISVPNELTDRIYLAHNDGQFICLHNHDYPTPQRMKDVPFAIPLPRGKR